MNTAVKAQRLIAAGITEPVAVKKGVYQNLYYSMKKVLSTPADNKIANEAREHKEWTSKEISEKFGVSKLHASMIRCIANSKAPLDMIGPSKGKEKVYIDVKVKMYVSHGVIACPKGMSSEEYAEALKPVFSRIKLKQLEALPLLNGVELREVQNGVPC